MNTELTVLHRPSRGTPVQMHSVHAALKAVPRDITRKVALLDSMRSDVGDPDFLAEQAVGALVFANIEEAAWIALDAKLAVGTPFTP